MKRHQILWSAAAFSLFASLSAYAGGEGWLTDFEAAKKQAAAENKKLLIDFTGSDWCIWCKKLDSEVFRKPEFKKGVADKYVLVEVDFPQDDKKLTEEQKKKNNELQAKYGVEGFPTVVLADAEGRPYAFTGYEEGGADSYVKHLSGLEGEKTKLDAAVNKAKGLEGEAKAKALVEAVRELPPTVVATFYGDLVAQIKEADPKDGTGFVGQLDQQKVMQELQVALEPLLENEDWAGATAAVDKAISEKNLSGETKQMAMSFKLQPLVIQEKFDEALALVDAIHAVDPKSEMGARADQVKNQLKAMKDQNAKEKQGEKPAPAKDKEAAKEAPKSE